ncbi:cell cycle checkpoint protein rad1 [Echinococcus multilocularis]|uniref:Cell cycle checkpoint protein rad1 n=1 Tax=Echinococcus multilocularis TaxID=6211 RepID=A0A068YC41_ECHMU|nr:cell cycle checkpoint protein rad1 [Echinococcus multilocularis]
MTLPAADGDPLVYAKTDNLRACINLLKAVHFRDISTIFISKNGVKVTVEDAKCVQGSAFMQSEMFQDYKITQPIIAFKINLNVLLDCLSVFGVNNNNSLTSVILCYKDYGGTLDLLLEDSGVVAECNIKTMDALEVLDFDFTSSQLISKVIMKPECMREAFSELDVTSDVLEVAVIPPTLPQPRLRLTTYGFAGTTHYDFPCDSDPVEVFECSTSEPCVARYRLSLLRPSTNRALALSSRISLRMNDRGFLSLQYMIQAGSSDSTSSFVEFFCVPDVNEPDECGFVNADTVAQLRGGAS